MKKLLSILITAAIACTLTACGNDGEGEVTTAVTTVNQTEATELSIETVLPDGWTMDELRNILIINGQTLTLPTTLNKIMELDENFSYEAEYVDENSVLYQGKKGFYVDVTYNDIFMFTTSFLSDINDINTIINNDISSITFSDNNCKKANINITTSCGIGFYSSQDDITNVFGEPNVYDYSESNRRYAFSDNDYEIKLFFDIYEKNNTLSSISISLLENGGQ